MDCPTRLRRVYFLTVSELFCHVGDVLTPRAGFDVLLPMTFAVESKQANERLARQRMVLQSKVSNPATFLGFMATVAAHRAILYGRHRDLAPSDENHDDLITDPDYKKVKQEALIAVRTKIQNREAINQNMVEACFGLISIATVVGNFQEARTHLKGIAQMVSIIETSGESMMWVPLSNVKVSVGLLSRPILKLPWAREAIPQEVIQRISPAPYSERSRLGSDFNELDLSEPLQALLSTSRDVCNFCEVNATESSGLSREEHAILRQKATELEFDLLAYPYETDEFGWDDRREPLIPAFEAIIRLAALGFLSFTPHTILPSTGLGRALTHHQKRAIEKWLNGKDANPGVSELKAVLWVLFIFTQNASEQPEERYFMGLLGQCIQDLWLLNWQDVETVLFGYLYIPRLQASIWKSIWNRVSKTMPTDTSGNDGNLFSSKLP